MAIGRTPSIGCGSASYSPATTRVFPHQQTAESGSYTRHRVRLAVPLQYTDAGSFHSRSSLVRFILDHRYSCQRFRRQCPIIQILHFVAPSRDASEQRRQSKPEFSLDARNWSMLYLRTKDLDRNEPLRIRVSAKHPLQGAGSWREAWHLKKNG